MTHIYVNLFIACDRPSASWKMHLFLPPPPLRSLYYDADNTYYYMTLTPPPPSSHLPQHLLMVLGQQLWWQIVEVQRGLLDGLHLLLLPPRPSSILDRFSTGGRLCGTETETETRAGEEEGKGRERERERERRGEREAMEACSISVAVHVCSHAQTPYMYQRHV